MNIGNDVVMLCMSVQVLTLANNERIPLTPSMRLLFEISHLKHATPATVSRAGILYINPQEFSWNLWEIHFLCKLHHLVHICDWLGLVKLPLFLQCLDMLRVGLIGGRDKLRERTWPFCLTNTSLAVLKKREAPLRRSFLLLRTAWFRCTIRTDTLIHTGLCSGFQIFTDVSLFLRLCAPCWIVC